MAQIVRDEDTDAGNLVALATRIPPKFREPAKALAVAIAYYVAAKLSLRLALVGESVTPLWPPTGIALVGFLWCGYRIWPAIALSAFLVNLPIGPTAVAAAGIAAGNTVAPMLARKLLAFAGFRLEFDRLRDVLALVFLGALASMTVSATAGTTTLLTSNVISASDYLSTWSVWWTGDAMGVLAVTPFLLGVRLVRRGGRPSFARAVEAVALFAGIAAAALSIQRTGRPIWVAVFALLGWAAWRFRQRGAGPAALIVIVAATWAAAHDKGPFAGTDLLDKMVMLQVFNATVSLTSFFFAAIVAERERGESERRALVERERLAQAQLYEREHRVVETLQRSLLPDRLPDIPDVRAVARYVPAATEVEIGGDWYDVIPLRDGRVGLGVGDVAGHGVAAAAAMGQVRMAFRAYLLEGSSPREILERLNSLFHELMPGAMATLVCALLDPESGSLTVARAGHPPPLVRGPNGEVAYLEGGQGPPLGVAPQITYGEAASDLPPGATVLLYTDGLVERRRESLDAGLRRLSDVVAEGQSDLEAVCDEIIARLLGAKGVADDAALLAIRRESMVGKPLHISFPAKPERLAPMRQVVGRWLRQNGWNTEEAGAVLVACTEACSNAIQHAYDSAIGLVEVDANIEAGQVAVDVRDFGTWNDPASSGRDDSSRGLPLMRALMDSVDVTTGPTGTTVRMRLRARDA